MIRLRTTQWGFRRAEVFCPTQQTRREGQKLPGDFFGQSVGSEIGNARAAATLGRVDEYTPSRPPPAPKHHRPRAFNCPIAKHYHFVSATNTPVQSAGGAFSRNVCMRVWYNLNSAVSPKLFSCDRYKSMASNAPCQSRLR